MKFPREKKEQLIEQLQSYFAMERGEEIGSIGAEQLLDFVMKEVEPHIYNQAIRDAKNMVEQTLMNVEENILSLEKAIHK
ncbi:DUF2164 domain-containing protein [Pontibacillus litoralis]|uniref:DUF2164 domain-containing protein n=1 Tax=Pontibacillus litoralis JSM 072002 TaxID=1385512 RepID=A0A0A5HSI5_9BACI|nr:DUF2164 domain-containing protein [Pontibacillus litoralis]KGX86582.1 hypothetical protein N784_04195 [Pontibacillus litoralis JSM 072002]